jgi:hypothetical protein
MTTLSPLSLSSSHSTSPLIVNNTPSEEDLTEDEVAIMVRNALRKARKAMSSPKEEGSSIAADSSEDNHEEDNGNDGETKEEDLAKRIEEEILGARRFAEKVYYGG